MIMNLWHLVEQLSKTELSANGVTLSCRGVNISRANKETSPFSLEL